MLPGTKFTPDDVWQILIRRKWLIIVPFTLGLAAAPPIAHRVPELYRSETVIMVVPQRVSNTLVRSSVSATVEDRLPAITDQILSRSRLETIVQDLNLYPEQRAHSSMEDVIRRMRADTTVEIEGKSKESFRVSYVSTKPEIAQKVTQRLASLYLEQDLRDRESLAESTDLLLESQLRDAKQRLLEQEKRLENYRLRFSGELPTQLQSNLQGMQNAQMQLQSISESINRARERRLLLERQLADAQALPVPVSAAPVGGSSDGQVGMSTAQQLELAEKRLDALKLHYTPDHPDVRTLERTIRDLKGRLRDEGAHPSSQQPEQMLSPEEAARRKRINDLQAEIDVIDHQIAANETEQTRLKARIVEYQSAVDALPKRESELVELTRDYGTLQETYSSLLAKREESKLAANLERRQIGEQWKILDPASLPAKSFNQKQRLAMIFSGAAAGLVVGLMLVGLLEYRDTSLKREEDVTRILGLPVLALIPLTRSDVEIRRRRYWNLALGSATLAVALTSIAALIFWAVRP